MIFNEESLWRLLSTHSSSIKCGCTAILERGIWMDEFKSNQKPRTNYAIEFLSHYFNII